MRFGPQLARQMTRAFCQQLAEAAAPCDVVDRVEPSLPIRGIGTFDEPTFFSTLHRERQSNSRRHRIESESIATGRRPEDRFGIRDAAQWTQGEQALVLGAHRFAIAGSVAMLAADRAGRTRSPFSSSSVAEAFSGNALGSVEATGSKVPRGQKSQSIERGHVRRRAEFPILRCTRPEASLAQLARQFGQTFGVGDGGLCVTGSDNRLELLRAHDSAQPTASGVASFRRKARERDLVLSGDPDRNTATARTHRFTDVGGALAPKIRRLYDAVDPNRRSGRRPNEDERVRTEPLRRDREVRTRHRVALVGAGYIASVHLEALAPAATSQVVALCDPALPRARSLAKRFGVVRVHGSVAELLEAGGVDAAHVLVPPDRHREVSEQLLRAGLHGWSRSRWR